MTDRDQHISDDRLGKGQCPDCAQWFHIVGGGLLQEHPGCPNRSRKPVEPVPCADCGNTGLALTGGYGRCSNCGRKAREAARAVSRGTCPGCGREAIVTGTVTGYHLTPGSQWQKCPGIGQPPAQDREHATEASGNHEEER
jgi:hypothetical protein